MKGEVAIICSTADPASLNIFQHMLELADWEDCGGYRSSGNKRLIIHGERQTALRATDGRFKVLGLNPEMVVFACRHQSEKGLPWMGGHFTGEIGIEKPELSAAAPCGLRSFLHNIAGLAPTGFRISAEATHHGPTDMSTPSFFAEIGSCQSQWVDPIAGEAAARAILSLEAEGSELPRLEIPVFLGFGGGHYVQRQTSLMFESKIAFGHLFSSYQIDRLDEDIVRQALKKSDASRAYIDRKSLRSEEKKKVNAILEGLGVPVMRSKEIRAAFPIVRDA